MKSALHFSTRRERQRKFQFEFIINKKGVKVWWALETMNRFNGPVSFMSSGPAACSTARVRAEKCTESFLLLALWEGKRHRIVVVEFMGDGWRGSEKVLNQEEQINAMLSRPFYQPFNIIGSRVRSLACAAQITSDQDRTRWVRSPS